MSNKRTIDALEIMDEEERRDPELAAGVQDELAKLKLGFKINQLRSQAKLSLENLGNKAGVSRDTISRLEQGDYEKLKVVTLLRVFRALGYQVDFEVRPSATVQGVRA